ncbi:MAG: LCP family protein [Caldilineaceae bacterium]|nr:LCP family protein [Caldilineaceae bacterium]
MLGYRKRLALLMIMTCAALFALFLTSVDATASTDHPIGIQPAQPTPPIGAENATDTPPTADRPRPNIIPHFAPPIPTAAPVTAPSSAVPMATPVWEAPIGPAINWLNTENYLILGTDRRAGAGDWRTDSIMIVGLDRAQRRAAVFSIPRDLYIEIPNYGYGRINQADFLGERMADEVGGGPKLVSQIISKTLGIQTNHWVRFQMDGFVRVVDAVGGVNVHLDCPFYEPIFNLTTQAWDFFTLPAGDNLLDGDSAYWFVRLRLRESDIGRSARQRQFLWALRDKMLSANLITRFPELWSAFQDSFATDLSLIQLVELTSFGISLNSENVRAGGLTLADLQNYRTEQGAAVLRIADPGRVRAIVNGVWDAPTMASSYQQDPTACAPLPQGVPIIETSAPVTTTEVVSAPITAGVAMTTSIGN